MDALFEGKLSRFRGHSSRCVVRAINRYSLLFAVNVLSEMRRLLANF